MTVFFLEAKALNSLEKAAFQQAEFCLTVFGSQICRFPPETEVILLTDTALKHLKSKAKDYKVADRGGMYVLIKSSGALTFRYDYRMNGRRETVTLGQYGPDGITLVRARELCLDARRMVGEGISPAPPEGNKELRGIWGPLVQGGTDGRQHARAMRRSIFDRDIAPTWKNRLLKEIAPEDLRALCGKVKDRGAPATAIHVRDIVRLTMKIDMPPTSSSPGRPAWCGRAGS
jgi:hypothetical protein